MFFFVSPTPPHPRLSPGLPGFSGIPTGADQRQSDNIWARLAESRLSPGPPGFSRIPTGVDQRQSEIIDLGGGQGRVCQILARQVFARPLLISAGREYSSPVQIRPTLAQMESSFLAGMESSFPAIGITIFIRKNWPATTLHWEAIGIGP